MDDWYKKLASDLLAETPVRAVPEAAAAMEIAFGHARSAITYALELARAHRFPATGRVVGDDVFLRFGDGQVRVTLNRRDGHVVVDLHVPGPSKPRHEEKRLHWKDGDLVDEQGAAGDPGALTREMIDVLVADWRSRPPSERKLTSAPPPDLDDEPTKT
ncbi:MAG: hypothetical protein ACLP1X_31650 [Polyangiaceae bacterium]|jgi:hypothetical protein